MIKVLFSFRLIIFIIMKNYLSLIISASVMLVTGNSCSSSRFVEPLAKKQHAIGVNLGGPLINFGGATIPTPLSSIVYGYGLDSNLTAFGGLHTTSLIFNNFHTDIGLTYKFINQTKYTPSLSGSLNNTLVTSLRTGTTRYWPQVDLNGYWNFSKRNHFWYVGVSNWFELRNQRANDEVQIKRWLPNPQAGVTFKTKTFQFNIEYKLLAVGINSNDVFVPYQSLSNNKGAMGLYFGVTKTF